MDKILKLRELIRPIFALVEQSKNEIDEAACDIEADNEIPDEEWDIVSDVISSIEDFCSAFEDFEEQIEERK